MTYNVGVILCVIFGLAFGYLILGFSAAEIIIAPRGNEVDTSAEPSLELNAPTSDVAPVVNDSTNNVSKL